MDDRICNLCYFSGRCFVSGGCGGFTPYDQDGYDAESLDSDAALREETLQEWWQYRSEQLS